MTKTHEADRRYLELFGCTKAEYESANPAPSDKRHYYKTAWTLVGGHGFTSNQCVAVRYLGLKQYRINETAETLHECHLTRFVL